MYYFALLLNIRVFNLKAIKLKKWKTNPCLKNFHDLEINEKQSTGQEYLKWDSILWDIQL